MGKTVTATEFVREFGKWQGEALKEPVTITTHGRASLVVLDAGEYERLSKRSRRAVLVSALSESQIAAAIRSQAPAEAKDFDDELEETVDV